MKKNILVRTNALICMIILIGFLSTAVLSYKANYSASIENIEQVSALTSEGIYYRINTTLTRPVNTSQTMANDSLLKDLLSQEDEHLEDAGYVETIQKYLDAYRVKYDYDSVFLASANTNRYYNFNGLDRVLTRGDPENDWYYAVLEAKEDCSMNVDNDEAAGAGNEITVFVNCKIRDSRGEVIGVVGVGLRISYLQQMLEDYQSEFGVNAYLIDDNGTIEISPKYSGYETVNLFEVDHYGEKARQNILNWREEGKENCFWDLDEKTGEKRDYVVARYLPELRWHLVVEHNTSEFIKKLKHQMTLTVAVIFSIIVFILYIVTRVIRSFNKHIITLTQAVEQERKTVFEKATEELFDDIYELDITNNRPANPVTEAYFESQGAPSGTPFDKALRIIADKRIRKEFRQGYLETFLPDRVLKAYEEGKDTLRYECMLSDDGRNYYWMRITARIVRWESDGSIHLLVYRQNIDAEKRQERRMQELAQRDEMTGLLTKTATRRSVEKMLESGGEHKLYAYFIMDIDNFKQANDQYGHSFGDSVIKTFAKTLKKNFRREDIIGRIGGDEFAAFVPAADEKWAEEKAQTLNSSLDCMYTEDGKSWKMSASIGVAFASQETADYKTIYENADAALYQSKRRGKGVYTIDKESLKRVRREIRQETAWEKY